MGSAPAGGTEALALHRGVLAEAPFPAATVSGVLRDACQPIVDRLQDRCTGVRHALAEEASSALAEACILIAEAPLRLAVLEAVLPATDPLPGALHDELAATAVRAAVGHVNAGGDVPEAESLLAAAAGLARESTTRALVELTRVGLARAAILAVVEPWLAAGDPDGAREVLRTWSRRPDVMERQELLDRMVDDPRALRAELSEVPTRVQLLGCGVRPFGRRAEAEDTWLETRFGTVFWVPVYPLASYLSDEEFVYAKVPSPRWAGILRPGLPISVVLLLVAGVLGLWVGLAAILAVIAVLIAGTVGRRRSVARWLDESLSEPDRGAEDRVRM